MAADFPTLFVSHGAPDIETSAPETAAALRLLAGRFARPESVLVVSAHWIAQPAGVTGGGQLETIHDYAGFDPELYKRQYPARGDETLSKRVLALLQGGGIEARQHAQRGLDHGAWVPLALIYPDADIPVVQLSLPTGPLTDVARLGEAIAPLRQEGVLIIGSGGSVHNLYRLKGSGPPESWAPGFEQWLLETIGNSRFEALLDPGSHTSHFEVAHPTPEHFAPLVLAWAAGGTERSGERLHDGFSYGNLGMSCYRFGN
mgnify:FL=1